MKLITNTVNSQILLDAVNFKKSIKNLTIFLHPDKFRNKPGVNFALKQLRINHNIVLDAFEAGTKAMAAIGNYALNHNSLINPENSKQIQLFLNALIQHNPCTGLDPAVEVEYAREVEAADREAAPQAPQAPQAAPAPQAVPKAAVPQAAPQQPAVNISFGQKKYGL
jgi:hypothetical protein